MAKLSVENLSKTKDEKFYGERQLYTQMETLGKIKSRALKLDKNNLSGDSNLILQFDFPLKKFNSTFLILE